MRDARRCDGRSRVQIDVALLDGGGRNPYVTAERREFFEAPFERRVVDLACIGSNHIVRWLRQLDLLRAAGVPSTV